MPLPSVPRASLLALLALAACADAGYQPVDLDRSCVPAFPEMFVQDGSGPLASAPDCEEGSIDPEPSDAEIVRAYCFEKADPTEACVPADAEEILDAVEHSVIYDCSDCLRDEYRIGCAVASESTDQCCYSYLVTNVPCSTTGDTTEESG